MSAFYGYIRWDVSPVVPEKFACMREAMERYPHDGTFYWQEGICAMGHLLQWDTPESLRESFPLTDPSGDIVFMSAGRIDNRDDLFRLLEIPHAERASMTDGGLMFRAYSVWGRDACERMLGDWSFCVWHRQEKRLFLGRDHLGIMALYYYQGDSFFAFASSLKGLLCLPEVPRTINELRIAQILTAWPGDGEQTSYQYIYNLKPGYFLEVQEGRVRKTKYWELKEQPDLILPTVEAYYERFREIFFEAVRVRLRSYKNVGIMLSGGYDSTSVAAVAAMELAKQNRELYAFTSVPYFKNFKVRSNRIGDEGPLAASLLKKYPNIKHFLVNSENKSVFDSLLSAFDILLEPVYAAGNQYWIQDIFEKTEASNLSSLLSGQGGNATLSWPNGQVKYGGFRILKNLFKEYFCRRRVQEELLRRFNPYIKLQKIDYKAHFSNDSYFRQIIGNSCKGKKNRLTLLDTYSKNALNPYFILGLTYKVHVLDPFNDVRLVNYFVSVPVILFKKYGVKKVFVLDGMFDILPQEIINNSRKGLQASDLAQRIRNEHVYDKIGIILENFISSKLIDKDLVIADYQKFKNGFSEIYMPVFLRTLSCIIFYSNYSKTCCYEKEVA